MLHAVEPFHAAVFIGKTGTHLGPGHMAELVIFTDGAFHEHQDRGNTDTHVHVRIAVEEYLEAKTDGRTDNIRG